MITTSSQRTFLNLFPAPEFLMLSTFGISITDYDTKLVELKREVLGDGFRLVHSSQTLNPEGAIKSGFIHNSPDMVSLLKELSSHFGIRYTRATLPDEKAYLFTATIDRVPEDAMRDAVAFILEENAPVSLAESVFDYHVVWEDPKIDKTKIAVSVLPKEVVNAYIEMFESAGVTPISFDLESQAIGRAVIRKGDKSPYLIINFAHHKTAFYVVENGVAQFSTSTSAVINGDTSSALNDLRAEMNKLLTYWQEHSTDIRGESKRIEKVILCGHGASREDLVSQLINEDGLKYEKADAWVNLSLSSRTHASTEIIEESIDYAPAIGVALSGRKTKNV